MSHDSKEIEALEARLAWTMAEIASMRPEKPIISPEMEAELAKPFDLEGILATFSDAEKLAYHELSQVLFTIITVTHDDMILGVDRNEESDQTAAMLVDSLKKVVRIEHRGEAIG